MTVCFAICLFCLFGISAQEVQPGAESPYQFGNPNAKHKFEIFIDFQCGACASFGEKLDVLKARYPDDIFVVFRNFPLPIPAHDKAFMASKVAESAGKQGKFWEMFDLLLKNQRKWSESSAADKIFLAYARKLRLNIEVFNADLQSAEIEKRVNLDIERARSLNLGATPSVLLNNKLLKFDELGNLEKFILEDK